MLFAMLGFVCVLVLYLAVILPMLFLRVWVVVLVLFFYGEKSLPTPKPLGGSPSTLSAQFLATPLFDCGRVIVCGRVAERVNQKNQSIKSLTF